MDTQGWLAVAGTAGVWLLSATLWLVRRFERKPAPIRMRTPNPYSIWWQQK